MPAAPFPSTWANMGEGKMRDEMCNRRQRGVTSPYPLNLLKVWLGEQWTWLDRRADENQMGTPCGEKQSCFSVTWLFGELCYKIIKAVGHKKHKWVPLRCFFYLWHNWNLMLLTFKSDILSALCSSLRMGGIPTNVL